MSKGVKLIKTVFTVFSWCLRSSMGETTSQKDARVERCRGQGVRLPAHAVYLPGCQASQHPSAWHGFRLVSGSPPRPERRMV